MISCVVLEEIAEEFPLRGHYNVNSYAALRALFVDGFGVSAYVELAPLGGSFAIDRALLLGRGVGDWHGGPPWICSE